MCLHYTIYHYYAKSMLLRYMTLRTLQVGVMLEVPSAYMYTMRCSEG
jgi:phosphoenolpyruvate-protein kinase (PTS system EI component)